MASIFLTGFTGFSVDYKIGRKGLDKINRINKIMREGGSALAFYEDRRAFYEDACAFCGDSRVYCEGTYAFYKDAHVCCADTRAFYKDARAFNEDGHVFYEDVGAFCENIHAFFVVRLKLDKGGATFFEVRQRPVGEFLR